MESWDMRHTINEQLMLGEVDIPMIKFDPRSRDDIPQLLLALQALYKNTKVKDEVFNILKTEISISRDLKNGRPGLDLWKILVLGTLRLTINCDYDRLLELANNHLTLREMLGHCSFNDFKYAMQTIKDNVKLLTVELGC
jgi:IS5 family transposase